MFGEHERPIGTYDGQSDFDQVVVGTANDREHTAAHDQSGQYSENDRSSHGRDDRLKGKRLPADNAEGHGKQHGGRSVVEQAFGFDQQCEATVGADFLDRSQDGNRVGRRNQDPEECSGGRGPMQHAPHDH